MEQKYIQIQKIFSIAKSWAHCAKHVKIANESKSSSPHGISTVIKMRKEDFLRCPLQSIIAEFFSDPTLHQVIHKPEFIADLLFTYFSFATVIRSDPSRGFSKPKMSHKGK